jgi:nitrite reductase (NADH) small subunit/3-phenylpropionate/trans-cinnamate dioxygenase ferredoxin subunit
VGKLHRVCDDRELQPGQGRAFWVEGRSIALFNVGGKFYAMENECTHEGGPLGDGLLRGERVLCPWHGAEFDVTTGAALSPPADFGVETFRVVVEGGEVRIELP